MVTWFVLAVEVPSWMMTNTGGIHLIRTEQEIREMKEFYEERLSKSFLLIEEHKMVIKVLSWVLGEAE